MHHKTVDRHIILGVHLTDRIKEEGEVQKQLTAFRGYIKTRLDLHEVETPHGSPLGPRDGLILLEMVVPLSKAKSLVAKLKAVHGVHVKTMVFGHPSH